MLLCPGRKVDAADVGARVYRGFTSRFVVINGLHVGYLDGLRWWVGWMSRVCPFWTLIQQTWMSVTWRISFIHKARAAFDFGSDLVKDQCFGRRIFFQQSHRNAQSAGL